MTIHELIELLRNSGVTPYTLTGRGESVAIVTPSLSGRVLATSFRGHQDSINGFVDADAFRHGMRDFWDNWGGEDRYWLCPEGGQFGLMFQGKENCFANYTVQPGINNQVYRVTEIAASGNNLTMQAEFELVNAKGTQFSLQSTRRITLLEDCPFTVGTSLEVESVGFESSSTITNIGQDPWTRDSGALAHWHLGQFPLGDRTVIVIPFRPGSSSDPPVREDYFREFCIDGKMPADRYSIGDGFVLLRADGRCRTKIGQNRSRGTGLIGSIDLDSNRLVFMDYDFYPNLQYAASYWYEQTEPYNGDCISVSAEGPSEVGAPNGRCYELESMSPAMLLPPGQSFTFRTRTMHVRGSQPIVADICRQQLGPSWSALDRFCQTA